MTYEEKRNQIEEWSDQAIDYEEGTNGKEMNLDKAFELYKKCAEYYDEDPDCDTAAACMEDVGRFYYEGIGSVAQDYSEAFRWYEKAIKSKEFYRWSDIAKMYEDGLGVNKNLEKAAELYLTSDDVDDWGSAYEIYHSGRINNPAKENEIRIKIAIWKRDKLYYDRGGYICPILATLLSPEKSNTTPPFTRELFIEYFNSDFSSDLRSFFDLRYDFADCTYPFVRSVACFWNENQNRKNMRWKGNQHYHMFSVAVFYMHTLVQAVGHLYGYRVMEDFLRSNGWPLINCGMGGHMHPIQVMYEGCLYPRNGQFESYINILTTSKDYMKESFSSFLEGNEENLNHAAYTRLCKTVV